MSLLDAAHIYKPFHYPWAYEAWQQQQQMHWQARDINMGDDVSDWHYRLTKEEKHLLTQIFRFFTQSDVEVNNCYMRHYSRVFKPTEIQMMLAAFSNMETIHIDAYSHMLDTLGMQDSEYEAFLGYQEMRNKYDYMQKWTCTTPEDIARTLAVFGAFTEGLQLFASFAVLLNFPRRNLMRGMGQIVAYSMRDETLHTESIIRLYHTFLDENPQISIPELNKHMLWSCKEIVDMEDAFIDLCFEMGPVEGMTPADIKAYIRYMADIRLKQLRIEPAFHIEKHPLPWLNEALGVQEHANFFESRATEYTLAATRGEWQNAFDELESADLLDSQLPRPTV